MFWSHENRPNKLLARQYCLQNVGQPEASLWLPGEDGECVNMARRTNVLSASSKIVLVEREPALVSMIQDKVVLAHHWQHQPHVAGCDLSLVNLPFRLNFAFLDLNGGLDKPTVYWLWNHLRRNLSEGATVCLTHSYGWRNNQFLYAFKQSDFARPTYRRMRDELKISDDILLTPSVIMELLFSQTHDFKHCWPFVYSDSHRRMILYKFQGFQAAAPLEITLDERFMRLITPTEDAMTRKKKTARHQAALKAWETRRRQAAEAEAEEAAKRDVRHQAALKAWETRRRGKLPRT